MRWEITNKSHLKLNFRHWGCLVKFSPLLLWIIFYYDHCPRRCEISIIIIARTETGYGIHWNTRPRDWSSQCFDLCLPAAVKRWYISFSSGTESSRVFCLIIALPWGSFILWSYMILNVSIKLFECFLFANVCSYSNDKWLQH